MRKSPMGVERILTQGLTIKLKAPLLGGPALFHEGEQMVERLVVGLVPFGGELMGALVELRSHFRGLLRRTAEGDQDLCQLGDFHAVI